MVRIQLALISKESAIFFFLILFFLLKQEYLYREEHFIWAVFLLHWSRWFGLMEYLLLTCHLKLYWKSPFCLVFNSASSDTHNISSLHQKCNTAFCEDEHLDDFDLNVECLVSIALLLWWKIDTKKIYCENMWCWFLLCFKVKLKCGNGKPEWNYWSKLGTWQQKGSA